MVGCGNDHTMSVMEEGGLCSWGCGKQSILGHIHGKDRLVPVRVEVEGLHGAKIVSVCGGDQSAMVTEDNVLYTWGGGGFLAYLGRRWFPGSEEVKRREGAKGGETVCGKET